MKSLRTPRVSWPAGQPVLPAPGAGTLARLIGISLMNDGQRQSECSSSVASTTELLSSLCPPSVQPSSVPSVCFACRSHSPFIGWGRPRLHCLHVAEPNKKRLQAARKSSILNVPTPWNWEAVRMNALYSHRITHDTGAAPDPFWRLRALVVCRPRTRRRRS